MRGFNGSPVGTRSQDRRFGGDAQLRIIPPEPTVIIDDMQNSQPPIPSAYAPDSPWWKKGLIVMWAAPLFLVGAAILLLLSAILFPLQMSFYAFYKVRFWLFGIPIPPVAPPLPPGAEKSN